MGIQKNYSHKSLLFSKLKIIGLKVIYKFILTYLIIIIFSCGLFQPVEIPEYLVDPLNPYIIKYGHPDDIDENEDMVLVEWNSYYETLVVVFQYTDGEWKFEKEYTFISFSQIKRDYNQYGTPDEESEFSDDGINFVVYIWYDPPGYYVGLLPAEILEVIFYCDNNDSIKTYEDGGVYGWKIFSESASASLF